MSNSPSEESIGTARIELTAADQAAELFLMDGKLRLLAKGRGSIVADVAAGVYKINVCAGVQTDQYVELIDPRQLNGGVFRKTYPLPRFASPVPLNGTSTADEAQIAAAVAHAHPGKARKGNGEGSWVFVLARDWLPSQEQGRAARPINRAPARGLTLWDEAGALVFDLGADGVTDDTGQLWSASHLQVKPGNYRLTLETASGGKVHQTVVATRDWQTQTFLLQRNYRGLPGLAGTLDIDDVRADLAGGSVLLVRQGGFDPGNRVAYLSEMTRMGLIRGRQAISDSDLNDALQGKFDNPLLGTMAALLMLHREPLAPVHSRELPKRAVEGPSSDYPDVDSLPSPRMLPQPEPRILDPQKDPNDRGMLKVVVDNLRSLLCLEQPHPDVEALALLLGPEGHAKIPSVPPLLRRSWALVLDASIARPNLVPDGSTLARVAQRLWNGEPWFLWMDAVESGTEGPASTSEALSPLKSALFAQLKRYAADEPTPADEVVSRGLTPVRPKVFEFPITDQSQRGALSGLETRSAGSLRLRRPDDKVMAHLVRNFGLPPSVLEELMMDIEKQIANKSQWCMAWYATRPKADSNERAALVKSSRWNSGDTITVSFLDGDPGVQQRVRDATRGWTVPGQTANLRLAFPAGTTDTLVRISFQYAGSWSVIGTTCKQVPAGQPTMNFGWLTPDTDDAEVRRVVLHEFGHALGLIHEHQNPGGVIHWDKDQVYAALSGPPNNWTKDEIDANMFTPYAKNETNFTDVDPKSIMMYPIPVTWTEDGFSAGLNAELSPTDIAFIHRVYP